MRHEITEQLIERFGPQLIAMLEQQKQEIAELLNELRGSIGNRMDRIAGAVSPHDDNGTRDPDYELRKKLAKMARAANINGKRPNCGRMELAKYAQEHGGVINLSMFKRDMHGKFANLISGPWGVAYGMAKAGQMTKLAPGKYKLTPEGRKAFGY